eukprot:823454-Pleurochrysis_carterae.AAC.1
MGNYNMSPFTRSAKRAVYMPDIEKENVDLAGSQYQKLTNFLNGVGCHTFKGLSVFSFTCYAANRVSKETLYHRICIHHPTRNTLDACSHSRPKAGSRLFVSSGAAALSCRLERLLRTPLCAAVLSLQNLDYALLATSSWDSTLDTWIAVSDDGGGATGAHSHFLAARAGRALAMSPTASVMMCLDIIIFNSHATTHSS